jgi:MoaA/NifB/PqqE/SkfB family radical SAM enzyme
MCNRTIFGGLDRPNRGSSDWTLEDIDRVFTDELTNLNYVYLCGTHGDPIAAKHLFEIVERIKQKNCKVEIYTNGSLRTDSWWRRFVKLFDKNDKIVFGVDGLETNHLYRQNTDINKILSHMKIACESNARVQWDFIGFKHNEHELEKCKEVANKLGVDRFNLRRTPRFDKYKKFPVIDKNQEITHYLEPPELTDLRHPSLDKIQQHGKAYEIDAVALNAVINNATTRVTRRIIPSTDLKFDKKITCLYKNRNEIYINSRLEVFPCCFISDEYETFKPITYKELKYPIGSLNLRNNSWTEILDHEFYSKQLVESFSNDTVIPRCISTCGIANKIPEQNLSVKL